MRRIRDDGTWSAVAEICRSSCLIVIEHEQPYGRREITLFAVNIDSVDKIPQRCPAAAGDILQWRVHFGASDTGQ